MKIPPPVAQSRRSLFAVQLSVHEKAVVESRAVFTEKLFPSLIRHARAFIDLKLSTKSAKSHNAGCRGTSTRDSPQTGGRRRS